MLVSDILNSKGSKVWTVSGQQNLREAVKIMVDNKIGAVLVTDTAGQPMGVFSERDFIRICQKNENSWAEMKLEKAMSPNVIICKSDDSLEYVMGIMTQQRIRHVPVAAEGRLCGIITIGDLVKAQLKATQVQIQYLKDYLHGT